jgi:hypothetical protein
MISRLLSFMMKKDAELDGHAIRDFLRQRGTMSFLPIAMITFILVLMTFLIP